MNKLTVVPSDGAVYVDGVGYHDFDLSFVPSDVHALQWLNNTGWIERNGQPNEVINSLPDWATQAQALWQARDDEIKNPPPISPTVDDFIAAIKIHFDTVAQEKQFDGALSIASYVTSANEQWKAEADAFIPWRDACWEYAYQEFAKFQSGERPMPTIEAFIAELPIITWPS